MYYSLNKRNIRIMLKIKMFVLFSLSLISSFNGANAAYEPRRITGDLPAPEPLHPLGVVPGELAEPDKDPSLPETDCPKLHHYINTGDNAMAQTLINAITSPSGILFLPIEAVDKNEQTAMHRTVITENTRILEMLLNAHACPNPIDRFGKTPLDYAKKTSLIYTKLINVNALSGHEMAQVEAAREADEKMEQEQEQARKEESRKVTDVSPDPRARLGSPIHSRDIEVQIDMLSLTDDKQPVTDESCPRDQSRGDSRTRRLAPSHSQAAHDQKTEEKKRALSSGHRDLGRAHDSVHSVVSNMQGLHHNPSSDPAATLAPATKEEIAEDIATYRIIYLRAKTVLWGNILHNLELENLKTLLTSPAIVPFKKELLEDGDFLNKQPILHYIIDDPMYVLNSSLSSFILTLLQAHPDWRDSENYEKHPLMTAKDIRSGKNVLDHAHDKALRTKKFELRNFFARLTGQPEYTPPKEKTACCTCIWSYICCCCCK